MSNSSKLFDDLSTDTVSYFILTSENLKEVSNFLDAAFYPYENISVASDVAKNPKATAELNLLCSRSIINDAISVGALDKATNKIIGVAINKVQEKCPSGESFFEIFTKNECKEKESASLLNTMISCDNAVDIYQILNTRTVIELVFLGVLPEYRRRGVGVGLAKATLRLLEKLGERKNGPKAVTSVFTSNYSQRIGESLGFRLLATLNYTSFSFNGTKFCDKINSEHKTMKVYAKKYELEKL